MFVVHATEALRAKLKAGAAVEVPDSTTSLGAWYANVLRWRSPVVVFVNEATLLPVLLPLAPARTLVERFPAAFAQVVLALGTAQWFVEAEVAQMSTFIVAKTANRSTVGMLNEFGFLADAHREDPGTPDLTALAVDLARTPCGPLLKTHIFPDRALQAHVADTENPPSVAGTMRRGERADASGC